MYTVNLKIITIRDRRFKFLQLTVEIDFGIFDRQAFPDQIEDTALELRIGEFGLLTESPIVGEHTLAQAGHESHMLPAFKLRQTQMDGIL